MHNNSLCFINHITLPTLHTYSSCKNLDYSVKRHIKYTQFHNIHKCPFFYFHNTVRNTDNRVKLIPHHDLLPRMMSVTGNNRANTQTIRAHKLSPIKY